MKVLFVRSDRLGDVLLSSHAVWAARHTLEPKALGSQSNVTFLVRPEYQQLLAPIAPTLSASLFSSAFKWARFFRSERFDAVVFLNWDFRIALGAFLARLPRRIGSVSKPLSRFLLNEGLRQQRSLSLNHEAEYGLELAEKCCRTKLKPLYLPTLGASRHPRETIVIHPGMGGSAPNWPIENYFEVGRRLKRQGYKVLFSVGPSDQVVRDFSGPDDTVWGGSLSDLANLFARTRVVLAPSTGPLHLAVAMGVPVVGIYPKEPVYESAKRWGPFEASSLVKKSFVFEVNPSQMSDLTVEAVLRKIVEVYGSRSVSTPNVREHTQTL